MRAWMKPGGRLLVLCAMFACPGRAAGQWHQDTKLLPRNAGPGSESGNSVSIAGDLAAVGAHLDRTAGDQAGAGAVYVFARNDEGWVQEAGLTASDAAAYDQFGSSVSLFADILVVGSPRDNAVGNDSGSAYIFRRTADGWVEAAKLVPSDGQSYDKFGSAVAAGQDSVLIGAPFDDDLGADSGSAYLYTFDGSTWVETAKLTAGDGASGNQFGASVALDGALAVVGAPWAGAGAAYAFRHDGEAWSQEEKLAAAGGAAGDGFGASVAARDNMVLVGAPRFDSPIGINAGAAYVFQSDGGSWVELARLTASDASSADCFGVSVALDGGCAAVGAHFNDDLATNCGSAYVYRLDRAVWVEEMKLIASDAAVFDRFGQSVALDGERVLAGAVGDDDAGENSGSAYLFTLEQRNSPPLCDAGGDYAIECGGGAASIRLDGTGSLDLEQDALSFRWTTDCPGASFDDPNSATPELRVAAASENGLVCSVTLSVSDGVNPAVSCDATVAIVDTTPPVLTAPELVYVHPGSSTDPNHVGFPEVSDCDPNVDLSYSDAEPARAALAVAADDGQTITRTWFATDASGNTSSFQQTIAMSAVVLSLDAKPGECPNAHNPLSKGYLTIALAGGSDFDLRQIDLASIRLSRADGVGAQLEPSLDSRGSRPKLEDVTAPNAETDCICAEAEPDGVEDLVLKFNSIALNEALELSDADRDLPIEIVLTGLISDPGSPLDGVQFTAGDCLELVGGGSNHEPPGRVDRLPPTLPNPCGGGSALALPLSLLGLTLTRHGRGRVGFSQGR